jgi:hypothetical protein
MLAYRSVFGAIMLCCLLWHLFLPTLVSLGVVPRLYVMPSHCQPVELSHHNMHMSNGHMMNMADMPHDMAHMDMNSRSEQLSPVQEKHLQPFHAAHAHQVFTLAAEIMKHCPLCSHGLEGAVLAPLFAFVLALLVCWFAIVRCLRHIWPKLCFISLPDFFHPLKQAPPVVA